MMIAKGLKDVVAAETRISHIDGEQGKLIYRGYDIGYLTANHSFEETVFLLWNGKLPSASEAMELNKALAKNRALTPAMKAVMNALPKQLDLMSVIRAAILTETPGKARQTPTIDQAVRLTAVLPTIIAYWQNSTCGRTAKEPEEAFTHIENYLYMMNGERPAKAQVDALETYMILTLEHGMNASTFSARVTASTESDMISAITSAIGTMKGPLHGGAPSGVIELLNEVEMPEKAEQVIRKKLTAGERLMGFGHRIYKTHDPRADALKQKLLQLRGKDSWLDLAVHVEKVAVDVLHELKPGRSLYTNVEFYAAAIMKSIDLASELFTPTFTAARIVGWTAHVLEQAKDNTIYRPQSQYIGDFKEV
ncbi:citrate synthase [Evansella caseinilytica]|uniref:Citrate synthase n=1 Tax=Evansella caseinilytica TaxID=1503961 RepID=A0A1H3T006_9BACI|nr:citrate synthase [Evansella caseinilytica]